MEKGNFFNFLGGVEAIKKRWHSLRTQFVKEKTKLKLTSGSGTSEESNWAYYKDLMWLMPYITDRKE